MSCGFIYVVVIVCFWFCCRCSTDDTAMYTVMAGNIHGQATSQASVIVKSKSTSVIWAFRPTWFVSLPFVKSWLTHTTYCWLRFRIYISLTIHFILLVCHYFYLSPQNGEKNVSNQLNVTFWTYAVRALKHLFQLITFFHTLLRITGSPLLELNLKHVFFFFLTYVGYKKEEFCPYGWIPYGMCHN